MSHDTNDGETSVPPSPDQTHSEEEVQETDSGGLYKHEPLLEPSTPLDTRGQTLFRRGVIALQEGDWDSALEIWRRAAQEYPNDAHIKFNEGLSLGALRQLRAATEAFHRASELDLSLPYALTNGVAASMSLLSYGFSIDEMMERIAPLQAEFRFTEVAQIVNELLDEYPNSVTGHAELAKALALQSPTNEMEAAELLNGALNHSNRAIFLEPTSAEGHHALATVQHFLGLNRESLQSLERVFELRPDAPLPVWLLAVQLTLREATDNGENDTTLLRRSVELANHILELEEANLAAWSVRVDANSLLMLKGEIAKSEVADDFRQLLKFHPQNERAIEILAAIEADIKVQNSQQELEKLVGPAFRLGMQHLEAEDCAEAVSCFQKVLEVDPDNHASLNNLSLALRRLERLAEALPIQQRLARLTSTTEDWTMTAVIAARLERYEDAHEAYAAIAKLSPDESKAHGAVAVNLGRLKRYAEAIPYWKRTIELAPQDDAAWHSMGGMLFSLALQSVPVDEKIVREAIPVLQRAHELDPLYIDTLWFLAASYAELGESDKALHYVDLICNQEPYSREEHMESLRRIHDQRVREGRAGTNKVEGHAHIENPSAFDTGSPRFDDSEPIRNTSSTQKKVATPLPPLAWGGIGLMMILGVWGLTRSGTGSISQPSPTPTPLTQVPVIISKSHDANEDIAPTPVPTPTFVNIPIMGWWQGKFADKSARLFIKKRDGNSFEGTLFSDEGSSKGLEVSIEGTLSAEQIEFREVRVNVNPSNADWRLGDNTGTIEEGSSPLQMSGKGSDGRSNYDWSLSRRATKPVVATVPSIAIPTDWETYSRSELGFSLSHPANWPVSNQIYENGRERVQFDAPQSDVKIIVDISDPTGGTPLEAWQSEDKRLQRKYGSNYRLLALNEADLGGQPGARWQFVLKKPGERQLRKIDRGVVYNGRGYALLMVAPAKDFEAWLPTFSRAVDSFSFN